jgi:PAS domain S-box-containing protein
MFSRLKPWLTAPVFADEEKTRIASLLHVILLAIFSLALLYGIVSLVVVVDPLPALAVVSLVCLFGLGIVALMRYGYVQLTSLIFSIGLWVIIAASMLLFGGMNSVSFHSLTTAVIIAGLLLGGRGGIVFAGLSIAAGFGLALMEVLNVLPAPMIQTTILNKWVGFALNFTSIAVLLSLADRNIQQALGRSRRNEHTLAENNRELQAVRVSLEQEVVERSQVEHELRDARDALASRYRQLFEEAPVLYVITRHHNTVPFIADCNQLFLRTLGYERAEVIGQPLANFYTSQSRAALLERGDSRRALAGDFIAEERELVTRDGRIVPTLLHIAIETEAEGQPIGTRAMYMDISERKAAETALRDSEARFRLLFANNPLPMWVYERDSLAFWEVNEAAIAHYGYTRDEFLRMRITDIRPPEGVPHLLDSVQRERPALQRAGEWQHRCKDGRIIDVQITSHALDFAGQPAALVVAEDITNRKRIERALADERNLLRTVMDSFPHEVFIKDVKGCFLMNNRLHLDLLGATTQEEVLGKTAKDYFPSDRVAQFYTDDQQVIQSGQPVLNREQQTRTNSGLTRWSLVSKLPLRDHTGRISGVVGVSQDITERKQAEAQLRQQNEYLAALHETTLALMKRLELSDVLQSIVARAAALAGTPHGYLFQLEPDGETMVMQVGVGFFAQRMGDRIRLGQSVAGLVWQSGQPLVVNDYPQWAGRVPHPLFDQLQTLMGVPLKLGEQVVGVLGLGQLTVGQTFETLTVTQLSQFAQLATIALDNARLYTAAQQELVERKQAEAALQRQNNYLAALHETTLALVSHLDLRELLEGIVNRAGVLLGTSHGYVFLLTPDGATMEMQVGVGIYVAHVGVRAQPGQGMVGKVWQTGQPMTVDDYVRWPDRRAELMPQMRRTVLVVPLKSISQVVGAIGLAYVEEERTFGAYEIETLTRFAQLASIALDNARLYTAIEQQLRERTQAEEALRESEQRYRQLFATAQRQAQELALLDQIRTALARELELSAMLRQVVEAIAETFGYKLIGLYLLEGDALVAQSSLGFPDDKRIQRIPITQGVVGRVARTGQPVFLEDVSTDSAFLRSLETVTSEICVPLLDRGHVVGVLNVESTGEPRLSEADLRMMMLLSDHVGLAIGHARLYTELQEHERALQRQTLRLQTAAEIGRIVTSILELDSLLPRITDLICERFDYYYVAILLLDETANWATLRAASGAAAQLILTKGVRLKVGGHSLVGVATSARQPRVAQDVTSDDMYFPHPLLPDVRAEAVFPLLIGEQVIGVLDLESARAHVFTHGTVSSLTTLAAQIAVAIRNAQLHAAQKERARELEQAYRALQENQQKLLISEKMASLGRLTAGIAHEMNTPLASMRASLNELSQLAHEYQMSCGDPDVTPADHRQIVAEMQQAIQLASSASERAASFVRSIKTQTRDLATREYRRFNAVPALREALTLLSHALRHGHCVMRFEPASELIELYGSPGRLAQVITNLVTNAIDASAPKGGGVITVRLAPHDQHIILQVSDQGSGIAPEHLTKIFDPMFTTKPFGQGTGLGLAIVHDVVVGEFGGAVTVNSEVGQGATFTIQFPFPKEE